MGNYKSISGLRITIYVLHHGIAAKNPELQASSDMLITEDDKSSFKEAHQRVIHKEFNL